MQWLDLDTSLSENHKDFLTSVFSKSLDFVDSKNKFILLMKLKICQLLLLNQISDAYSTSAYKSHY